MSGANSGVSIPASEALSTLIASSSTTVGSGAGSRKASGEVRGGASDYRYGRRTDGEYRPEHEFHIIQRRRGPGERCPVKTYGSGSGSKVKSIITCGGNELLTTGDGYCLVRPTNGDHGTGSIIHLMVQRGNLNDSLFTHYLAIYNCLEQLLQGTQVQRQKDSSSSTSDSPTTAIGAPSLVALAIHALAHCILATSPTENPNSTLPNYNQTNRDERQNSKQQEIPQSDWYEGVQEVSSTYLPTLLRFHAIEVVAQSIRTRGIDCNLGSMLAGLCFEMDALHEGEVIVREILQMDERRGVGCIYVYLIYGNKEKNPELAARGWRLLREYISCRLPEVGIDVLATMISGVGNRTLRERAWGDWLHNGTDEARKFVLETMRIAFGIWGAVARDDVRMRMCRIDKLRRNGIDIHKERGAAGVSMVAMKKLKKLVYGNNTLYKGAAKKIVDSVLEFLDTIAKTALGLLPEMLPTRMKEAKELLLDLAEGFLGQSGEVRNVLEAVWGGGEMGGSRVREKGSYPKDAKVLVLLFVLIVLEDEEYDGMREQVSKEIARVLDEEKYAAMAAAKEAAKNSTMASSSTATVMEPADDAFIEQVVDHLLDFYSSDGISVELGHEGVRKMVKILMDIAFPSKSRLSASVSSGASTAPVPATPGPKTPAPQKLTWTPAVNNLSPEDEATSVRYYLSRLALLLATRFSSLPETKYSEQWVDWVEEIEKKVLTMPIPTPARKPPHYLRRRRAPGERSVKKSTKKQKEGGMGWRFEEGLGAWVARTGATPGKNGVLGESAFGGAVRRSSRLSFTTEEGGVEVVGRKWVFDSVLLSPMARMKDGYELFSDGESEGIEESVEEEDEPMGVTEVEDNHGTISYSTEEEDVGDVTNVDTSDDDFHAPHSPARVRKSRSKYILPTSASSLSSEGEQDFDTESPPKKSEASPNSSPFIPPSPASRPKRTSALKTNTASRSRSAYRAIKQHQQRLRRQSTRIVALPPKRYDVDGSSSSSDGLDGDGDDIPQTGVSMLSSPPPEEVSLSKHRPRRISAQKKQLSLLDLVGEESPVARRNNGEMKRKAEALDTPVHRGNVRKRARVEHQGEEEEEADDEHDKYFTLGSARKGKKSAVQAGVAPGGMRKKRKISNIQAKAEIGTGHEDVFMDGNKWDLRARDANTSTRARDIVSGAYSSPPESSRSRSDAEDEDEDEGMESWNSGEEKEDPDDTEFKLISPPGSADRRKQSLQHQLRKTRSSIDFVDKRTEPTQASRVQKRKSMGDSPRRSSGRFSTGAVVQTSLKKTWGTTKGEELSVEKGRSKTVSIGAETTATSLSLRGNGSGSGRTEGGRMKTRRGRSVGVKSYVELPDEGELSEDELCASGWGE